MRSMVMNKQRIASEIVALAKVLLGENSAMSREASVERSAKIIERRAAAASLFEKQNFQRLAARKLIAFNVPQKAEVLKKMLKVHGITINDEGKIAYWQFGLGGTIDYSKSPTTVGGGVSYNDFPMAQRQMQHMMDGADDEIAKMQLLLDATARFRKSIRESEGSSEDEMKEVFGKELTKPLADLARARMPAKLEIKKILEETQKLTDAGKFKEAINKSNEVDEHAFNLLKSWDARKKVYADRIKLYYGLDNARRKDPEKFNALMLEVMTGN